MIEAHQLTQALRDKTAVEDLSSPGQTVARQMT
jgi:hypothetical protein